MKALESQLTKALEMRPNTDGMVGSAVESQVCIGFYFDSAGKRSIDKTKRGLYQSLLYQVANLSQTAMKVIADY
jgi:hypothetical protein